MLGQHINGLILDELTWHWWHDDYMDHFFASQPLKPLTVAIRPYIRCACGQERVEPCGGKCVHEGSIEPRPGPYLRRKRLNRCNGCGRFILADRHHCLDCWSPEDDL